MSNASLDRALVPPVLDAACVLQALSATQPYVPIARPARHLNVLVSTLGLGGAERIVQEIWNGLAAAGATGELHVLSRSQPSYAVHESEAMRIHAPATGDRVSRLRAVAARVLASPLPAVFTHLLRPHDLETLWRAGVTTFPVIHSSRPNWLDPLASFDHPRVPLLVAVCEAVAVQLREAGWCRPIVTMRHEIAPRAGAGAEQRAEFRRRYGVRDDVLLIGMVGQVRPVKNHALAVRVLGEVARTTRAKLLIVGGWEHDFGGGRESYTQACREALAAGVMPDVIWAGSMTDVAPCYAAFDVLLNTSAHEGLSIAALEARQAGCPIVAASVGGMAEAIGPGDALIAEVDDPRAYAAAIRRIARPGVRRPAPKPPSSPDLLPRLWALLGRHAAPRPHGEGAIDTLFLSTSLNPGGAPRSLANLVMHLPASHRALVCVMDHVLQHGYVSAVEAAGVPVLSLADTPQSIDRAERVLELVERLGPRAICFWNVDVQLKLLLAKILAARDVRLVDTSPGPMFYDELDRTAAFQQRIGMTAPSYFGRIDRLVVKYVHGQPPPGHAVAAAKVEVIANGVPRLPATTTPTPSVLPPGADPDFAVVTACRLVSCKQIEWLIEMMVVLRRAVPGATLTIFGGLDRRHLPYWQSLVERLAQIAPGVVHFAGARRDVPHVLAQFPVFVMYSKPQGCPNASLEAMAAGRPVVANDEGGASEQIEHGVTGYLCRGDDPAEMARLVAELLLHPARARALGRAGQKRAQRHFSMAQMVDRYVRLLEGARPRRPLRLVDAAPPSAFVEPRLSGDGRDADGAEPDGPGAARSSGADHAGYGEPGESAAAAPGEPQALAIELVDEHDQPIAGARYLVRDSSGEVVKEGQLGDDGRAREPLADGEYTVEFPDFTDVDLDG